MTMNEPLLSKSEAAELLGFSIRQLQRHMRAGRLEFHSVRGRHGVEVRFSKQALEFFKTIREIKVWHPVREQKVNQPQTRQPKKRHIDRFIQEVRRQVKINQPVTETALDRITDEIHLLEDRVLELERRVKKMAAQIDRNARLNEPAET
jgi:excisionase family DNA binding protein